MLIYYWAPSSNQIVHTSTMLFVFDFAASLQFQFLLIKIKFSAEMLKNYQLFQNNTSISNALLHLHCTLAEAFTKLDHNLAKNHST